MDRFRKQLLEQIERWQAGIATLAPKPIGAVDDLRRQALQQLRHLAEPSPPVNALTLDQMEHLRRSEERARSLGLLPEKSLIVEVWK